jgi:molybdopterin-containing oxidoreductase family iron-sulfur binding subunit
MEKCTFCVQRIQGAERAADAAGLEVADGDIRPACAAACPAQVFTFGDLEDPESRVSRLAKSPRAHHLLGDLGTQPGVIYLEGADWGGNAGDGEAGDETEPATTEPSTTEPAAPATAAAGETSP